LATREKSGAQSEGSKMDAYSNRDTRREEIEREIASNPERSNREIARQVGADHKTVGSVRSRMAAPKNSPAPASEAVGNSPLPQTGDDDDDEKPLGMDDGRFDWHLIPNSAIVIPPRMKVAALIDPQTGCLVIAQDRVSLLCERDAVIEIAPHDIASFIARLIEIARNG
jgi:hypothetical protein